MSTRLERRIVAKAASYVINPTLDRPGTVFTNRGATGTVNFTLPVPNAALRGWWYRFKCFADFTLLVQTAVSDTMVTFNDQLASALALQTAGTRIGGEMEAFCDGTNWFVSGLAVGHSYTVTA